MISQKTKSSQTSNISNLCFNHSPITNHQSLINFPFRGNWLVNYDQKEFNYPDILITLAKISDFFKENRINFASINVNFNKNEIKNLYYKEKDNILLSFCGLDKKFEEKNTKPCEPAVWAPLNKPIKTISLLFPRLESDPRWKSMGVPAGQVFLASNLSAGGFEPSPLPLTLPGENPPVEALKADMTGFTLFEDLLGSLRPFLAIFRGKYAGVIAAGGPFPTLSPLAAAFHLPQVNLLVRGEAEMVLPGMLEALNRGDADAFFARKGVLWQRPGLIAISGLDQVNRPKNFDGFGIDLSFLKPGQTGHGLEMNFSRGCRRGCVFCCRVQGSEFRKLPLEKAEELLKEYRKKVDSLNEAWKSPRPLSGPPPLAKGVFKTKSFINDLSHCPPLPKGGDGGDSDLAGLMNQTPTNGNSKKLREGCKPSPTIERIRDCDDCAPTLPCHTLNINDDDIMQDPGYAGEIFDLVKKNGFRIFGIQTSPSSLVNSDDTLKEEVLDLAADRELFVEGRPLLWLGTDVFLQARSRRLGKRLPPPAKFIGLLEELEKRGLRHFHYWISSDGDSTWEEFVEELALILGFFRDFPGFGLLAHSPFVVPYPASLLFGRLPAGDPRLKIKLALEAADPRFSCKIVDRLETRWPQLNNLLKNEKAGGEKGFFDFLKKKEFAASAQLAYYFLKQEELQNTEKVLNLYKAKEKLEEVIGKSLE